MSDIIQLLPDNIANQIAAGEVIQRPASAVKELLENAVDAGATEIKLIIQDAGKSLVQVIDNGKGMSETDARMSFERHATSKIRKIDDLFQIRTMGFRGEALASIAAVAQVELRTKRSEDQLGTYIEIDNSVVKVQEPCSANNGTSIAMKNLFFNVPARRNFLKSNAAETRHIVDEFIHVALSFPELFFSFTSNGQQVFHLEKGNLKQRIVQLLGSQYNAKLVSVQEQTDYLNIRGFVGKPDTAKKTRGDQYIFVNNRYIRSAYLNHAIMSAYQDLIPSDSYPLYVLFVDMDPAHLDINVHPTKQEIKFDDEKIVYAFVQAAVKHALAQYSVMPTLDFDLDPNVQQLDAISKPFTQEKQDTAASSHLFQSFSQKHQAHFIDKNSGLKNWKDFYAEPQKTESVSLPEFESIPARISQSLQIAEDAPLVQMQNMFILVTTNRGFLVVNQQLAHERVLYERFTDAAAGKPVATQRSLFPTTLELSPADAAMLGDLLPDLSQLGYLLEPFGQHCYVIQGTPSDVEQGNEKQVIENLVEQYKHFSSDLKFSKREKLVRTMVHQRSIKPGKALNEREMRSLIEELFTCRLPNSTPDGSPTYIEFKQDYLLKMFNQG
ncbi:MAG TPA: DNA mismatch repair endonuclease MutL [Chitinophagaceae bacterium]|nr:DNA mismatch repair endonuclease MutL [Chitinophagaceae bacterium]